MGENRFTEFIITVEINNCRENCIRAVNTQVRVLCQRSNNKKEKWINPGKH